MGLAGLALCGGGQRQCLFIVYLNIAMRCQLPELVALCDRFFYPRDPIGCLQFWKNSKVYKYKESERKFFSFWECLTRTSHLTFGFKVKWHRMEGIMLFFNRIGFNN